MPSGKGPGRESCDEVDLLGAFVPELGEATGDLEQDERAGATKLPYTPFSLLRPHEQRG